MYYVYVLEGRERESQALYIGVTADLRKRLNKHLAKSIKTTKQFSHLKLVYYEACLNKKDAWRREKALKTGFGRGYLKRRLKCYFEGCV